MTGPEPRSFRAATSVRNQGAWAADRFDDHRQAALAELDDIDRLRQAASAAQDQVLADLPAILERFADSVMDRGTHVCWASTAGEARDHIAAVVRRHGARRVVADSSAVTGELGLNVVLEAQDTEVIDAGLGEWILELADEPTRDLIAPALHQSRHQVRALFTPRAGADPADGKGPEELTRFARRQLADIFFTADVGVTGVDLAVAETGSLLTVTPGGNDRLVTSLPRVHIAVVSMERVIETWRQADVLLSSLTRSAAAQQLPSYTTVMTGPRRAYELDGPDELHVVVLDNGRSRRLGSEALDPVADEPARGARRRPAPPSERTAWRMWGDAWSDAQTYDATTHAASWDRWAEVLGGRLPPAQAPTGARVSERDRPQTARQSFRDRWQKGLV